jgi:methyl-accepting chemotaxis protein
MRRMTIRSRLNLAFATLLTLLAAVSIVGIAAQANERQRMVSFVTEAKLRADLASEILEATQARAVAARNIVLARSNQDIASEHETIKEAHAHVLSAHQRLKRLQTTDTGISPQESRLISALFDIEANYGPVALRIVQLATSDQQAQAALELQSTCRPLLQSLVQAARQYRQWSHDAELALLVSAEEASTTTRGLMLGIAGLAMAVCIALALSITRSIIAPIEQAVAIARTIAGGNLSQTIRPSGRDEATAMLQALSCMQDKLRAMVQQMQLSSQNIAADSSCLASGNNALSQRTDLQAASLQNTAAAVEQMTSSINQSAHQAEQAHALAQEATDATRRCGTLVQGIVQTMGDISASSRQIEDIVETVNAIAFQTNILALNAAIEASRAGAQGRSFGVVAAEVRALAHRSSDAARDIGALIATSVSRVDSGSALVSEIGSAMGSVVNQVENVQTLIAGISNAVTEQGNGIGQISSSMTELDRATQQNTTLVTHSVTATDSLADQARHLADVVCRFRLQPTL